MRDVRLARSRRAVRRPVHPGHGLPRDLSRRRRQLAVARGGRAQRQTAAWCAHRDGSPVEVGRSEKMSKSKKNVVDPDQIIRDYGADTARWFMLSDSPPERDLEWTEAGVDGAWRFQQRLYRLLAAPSPTCRRPDAPSPRASPTPHRRCVAPHNRRRRLGRHRALPLQQGGGAALRAGQRHRGVQRRPGRGRSWALRETLEIFVRLIGPMTPHLGRGAVAVARPPRCWPTRLADGRPGAARRRRRDGGGPGERQAARHHAAARRTPPRTPHRSRPGATGDRRAWPASRPRRLSSSQTGSSTSWCSPRQIREVHQWLANRTTNSNAASAIGSRPSRSPRKPRPRRRRANAPGWRMPGRRTKPMPPGDAEKT